MWWEIYTNVSSLLALCEGNSPVIIGCRQKELVKLKGFPWRHNGCDVSGSSWDVGRFETLDPLSASELLAQKIRHLPQRVYLRLAGNSQAFEPPKYGEFHRSVPDGNDVTDDDESTALWPAFAYGGRRPAELCYGCEKGVRPQWVYSLKKDIGFSSLVNSFMNTPSMLSDFINAFQCTMRWHSVKG